MAYINAYNFFFIVTAYTDAHNFFLIPLKTYILNLNPFLIHIHLIYHLKNIYYVQILYHQVSNFLISKGFSGYLPNTGLDTLDAPPPWGTSK
jgi:hypothetical protein